MKETLIKLRKLEKFAAKKPVEVEMGVLWYSNAESLSNVVYCRLRAKHSSLGSCKESDQ